jgi:pimeloyl-ACP methyl ester carboxylesterase
MTNRLLNPTLVLSFLLLAGSANAQAPASPASLPTYAGAEPFGVAMEGWAYPYPVQMLQFELEGRTVRMAYMDVHPAKPNGKTVVLFHGKNFAGDYWGNTLRELSARGYRVIAPDQIGFGKSSKPETSYTFSQLADNTTRLLDHLKVGRVAIVANSMGGMLGVHFARSHPERVTALVLENPLGLEDYVHSIHRSKRPHSPSLKWHRLQRVTAILCAAISQTTIVLSMNALSSSSPVFSKAANTRDLPTFRR